MKITFNVNIFIQLGHKLCIMSLEHTLGTKQILVSPHKIKMFTASKVCLRLGLQLADSI